MPCEARSPTVEFQSTPPHGGQLLVGHIEGKQDEFQSTPPHGGQRYPRKRLQGNDLQGGFREPPL